MINFNEEVWKLVVQRCEEQLANQRAILELPERSYKEKLIANGQVMALKTLLKLPESPEFARKV